MNDSTPPADRTPGHTPNGGPFIMRRPKNANPLVQPRKRQPARAPTTNGAPSYQQANGVRYPDPSKPQAMPERSVRPNFSVSQHPVMTPKAENIASGFSSPPIAPFQDFPLVLSKSALVAGFRHHVARFSSKRNVDPRDEREFVRPVRLQRRDPRAPPMAGAGIKNEDQSRSGMETLNDQERTKEEALRAERDAQREAEMALNAPTGGSTAHRKAGKNQKKTEQVFRNDTTEEQKAKSKLRYEEALPWHIEDFENKNTWVGTYEAALSDTYAMMMQGSDGVFRIVPVEKWYKFTQKGQFKILTIEEAEKSYGKKTKEPRWFMESEEAKAKKQAEFQNKKAVSGLRLGKWEKGGGHSGSAAPITKHEDADADDLDFQEDRFADDEENMLFEEDDETKEAEERIRKDQLKANVFDLKEEKEYDKEEKLKEKEKEVVRKHGKGVKKALKKREKNFAYESDSSEDPYGSSESESESTETERQKEEERKKAEENKSSPEKDKLKAKVPSGTSSKGTTTPSQRPSKHGDPLKHSISTNNLKRPGSPLGSEASGNESTRKKHKKHHPFPQPTGQSNTNLQPPSRPGSPPLPPPSSSANQPTLSRKPSGLPGKRQRAGSGSDSEGGEMSDGTKRQKLILKTGSKNGTPQSSRAGSPDVPNGRPTGVGGSRAASPVISPPASDSFPTAADIRAAVPATGITVAELLAKFKGQRINGERKNKFIQLMKENTKFERTDRKLLPLDHKP